MPLKLDRRKAHQFKFLLSTAFGVQTARGKMALVKGKGWRFFRDHAAQRNVPEKILPDPLRGASGFGRTLLRWQEATGWFGGGHTLQGLVFSDRLRLVPPWRKKPRRAYTYEISIVGYTLIFSFLKISKVFREKE